MLDDMSPIEVSSSVFPENRFEAMEEIRRLLGLTDSDFACMIRLLCKSCYSNLNFVFGAVSIALSSQEEEVCLEFSLSQERRFARSVEYWFKPSDLGVYKKQRKISDFEEE